MFARAASGGDARAAAVVASVCEHIGVGCINLCRVVDPSVIILTGGMALAGEERLLRPVRAAFAQHHWTIARPTCEIVLAACGNDAGAVGAAAAARLAV